MAQYGIKAIWTIARPLEVVKRMDNICGSLSDFDSKLFLEAIDAFKNGDINAAKQLFVDAQDGVLQTATVEVSKGYVVMVSFDEQCEVSVSRFDSDFITITWLTPTIRKSGMLVERFKDDSSFLMISKGGRTWENGNDAMKILEAMP